MGLNKILVATDFSPDASAAIDHAAALAVRHGAELIVLHVSGAAPSLPSLDVWANEAQLAQLIQMQELRRAGAAAKLDDTIAALKQREVKVRSLLYQGHAVALIDRAARDEDVDLIVTGARGVGAANVFIIGSVTEGLIRRSDRNVLVARDEPRAFDKVLMATDLTDASLAVIPMALALASPDAEVELMHVVEWGDHAPMVRGPHGSPAVDFKKLWRVALEEAEKELTRLLEGRHQDAKIRHRVTDGVAASAILERAREGGHQLLVVGKTAHEVPGHERVAERVIRHATCPVLVARSVPSALHVVSPSRAGGDALEEQRPERRPGAG